jgi:hypothetical protein
MLPLKKAWPITFETTPDVPRSALGAPVGEPVPLAPPPVPRKALGAAGLLLAVEAAVAAGWVLRDPPRLIAVLLFLSAAIAVEVTGACFFFRTIRRGLLTLHERGLAVGWPGRERAMLFADIRSFSLLEQESFQSMLAGAVLRRITVRSATSALRFGHEAFDGRPDRVTPVLRDLLLRLADVCEQRLGNGEALNGPGWSLTVDGLRPGFGAALVPLTSLARVEILQRQVRAWKEGGDRPFFTAAAGSPNAHLLLELLARRLAGLGLLSLEPAPPAASPLGRFLFALRDPADLWLRRVEVHENGLAVLGPFRRRREMLFTGVERMRLRCSSPSRRRVTYEGRRPGGGMDRISVRFAATQENHRLFLGRAAAAVADKLAGHLAGSAAAAHGIAWVGGVRITREGIVYPRRRWHGREEPELAPFAEQLRVEMSADAWRLYRAGRTKPSLVLNTAAWNFLPGLVLLERRHRSGLLDGVGASV